MGKAPRMDDRRFEYLPYLDGLRAVSILAVMSHHGLGPISAALFGPSGWFGVQLFFVLSGFLITGLLLAEERSCGRIDVRRFLLRRAARIVPACWLFVLVALRINPHDASGMGTAAAIAALFMSDYALAHRFGAIAGSGLELTWSLGVEEKFYLVWPPLLRALRSIGRIGVVTGLLAAALLWKAGLIVAGARGMGAFDTQFDAILWGALAALFRPRFRAPAAWWILPTLVLLVVLSRTLGPPVDPADPGARALLWLVRLPTLAGLTAFMLLLLVSRPVGWVARALSTRWLAGIGRISYSLYLWHLLTFTLVNAALAGARTVPDAAREPLRLAAALLVAAASYVLVERPFQALRRRLRPDAQRAAATVEPLDDPLRRRF